MSAWAHTGWGRWVAMLCIALFAFVLTEDVLAIEDPCHGETAVEYNVAYDVVRDRDQSSPDGAPVNTLHRHHCCGAHSAGLPSVAMAGDLMPMFVSHAWPIADERVTSGAPGGLERPPKQAAIV